MGKISQDEHDFRLMQSIQRNRTMAGKFFYSKEQRRSLDKLGRPRFFCSINGEVKEYTEFIDFEELQTNPLAVCPEEDADYLGTGFFSHRTDPNRM